MEIIKEIFSDLINDPKDSMRSILDRDGLFDLAEDIKKNGLINPITVRPIFSDGLNTKLVVGLGEVQAVGREIIKYEVVAGHRRLGACKIAGIIKIPCVVKELDDNAAFSIMASENLVREDVDPVDEAEFIIKMMSRTNQNIDEVAANIRRSRQYVVDRLIVGEMPDYLKEFLRMKQIKLGAALSLNQITDENIKRMWVGMAVRDGVSVRVAEYWLTQWKMSQLPDAVRVENPLSDITQSEFKPLLFRCAIDGKEYPVEQTKMVSVFLGNLDFLVALRNELSFPPQKS